MPERYGAELAVIDWVKRLKMLTVRQPQHRFRADGAAR